jgi:transposase
MDRRRWRRWYRQVHVKSRQCRLWRSLLVARRTVLNEMRSIENVVRAVLRAAGVKLGTPSRAAFAGRVRELAGDDVALPPLVEPLLAIRATMLGQLARLTKQVRDIVRGEAVCRRLMSVPWRRPDHRARLPRHGRPAGALPAIAGGGRASGSHPARCQAGETDIQGKVSRCGDELARTARDEAAHRLLVRGKKWSSRRAWGMTVAQHRGPVGSADIPPGDRAKPDGARPRRGRPQARRRPAPHVERPDRVPLRQGARCGRRPGSGLNRGGPDTTNSPGRVNRIVPVGTMSEATSLRVPNLQAKARKVVQQIELRRLALLTPSCGGHAPTAKSSEDPRQRPIRKR